MAKVIITVPDGKHCGSCGYLRQGTIHCLLFDSYCDEVGQAMKKHSECPQTGSTEHEPWEVEE